MSHYIAHYEDQIGGGLCGVRNVFSGSRYQRGRGIGSWLGGIFRTILPFIKSGAEAVGKEALHAGMNVFDDVANNGVSLRESLKERARESGNNLKRKAGEKLADIMKGSGYEARVSKRRRQSGKIRVSTRNVRKKTLKNRSASDVRRKKSKAKVRRRKKNKLRNISDIFGPAYN